MRRVLAGLVSGVIGVVSYIGLSITFEKQVQWFDLFNSEREPLVFGATCLMAAGTFALIEFLGVLPPALRQRFGTVLHRDDSSTGRGPGPTP